VLQLRVREGWSEALQRAVLGKGSVPSQPRSPAASWASLKQRGQQGEGGDSAPLLHSGEILPGVLRPALEPPAQERHGLVGAGPQEAIKMIQGLEHLFCEGRLRELGLFPS